MIKMVVFDLDGTLVDSLVDLAESVNKGLEEAGLETHPVEKYNQFVGNGRDVLIKLAMGKRAENAELFQKVRDVFDREYAIHCNDNTKEYPGCADLLSKLSKSKVMTAVLSNKPDEFVGDIVKKVYPNHSFVEAWGQKKEYKRKPDGEALVAMLEMYGVSKEECMYVGDSDVDVFTAKNAGVKMAGVNWGFRGYDELINAGAEFVARNTDELYNYIMSC